MCDNSDMPKKPPTLTRQNGYYNRLSSAGYQINIIPSSEHPVLESAHLTRHCSLPQTSTRIMQSPNKRVNINRELCDRKDKKGKYQHC